MSDQLAFDMARTSDPDTSHGAAIIALHGAANNRQLALHHHATTHTDGLTDFELADLTNIQQTSIGKRRGELVAIGYIERARDDNGVTMTRPSPTGTPAAVWTITSEGLRAYAAGTPIPKPPRRTS
jgi:hypothetical protein